MQKSSNKERIGDINAIITLLNGKKWITMSSVPDTFTRAERLHRALKVTFAGGAYRLLPLEGLHAMVGSDTITLKGPRVVQEMAPKSEGGGIRNRTIDDAVFIKLETPAFAEARAIRRAEGAHRDRQERDENKDNDLAASARMSRLQVRLNELTLDSGVQLEVAVDTLKITLAGGKEITVSMRGDEDNFIGLTLDGKTFALDTFETE